MIIRISIFLLIIFHSFSLHGQITVSGNVINEKGEELPYVNIGFRGKNIGTCSDFNGKFLLVIPQNRATDTLTFSRIGYTDYCVSVSSIKLNKQENFQLKKKPYQLKEVSVSAKRLKEKKYGISRYNPVMHFIDASIDKNDIFEIAQVIHLPINPAKLTSVNLFINEPRKDTGIFRVNFYQITDGFPSKKLNEKEIIQRKGINEGWLKFDISNENIFLKGDIVVALEFIPTTGGSIKYEVKVGGTSKSYVRTSSLGEWQIPPHHYRLYVTALVSDDKNEKDDLDEEKESVPATRLYSKNIKDTLSLFVSLPKGYSNNKTKKYPVVYLLDANVYFDLLKDNSEDILVGIGYKNAFVADSLRERDYTYPKASKTDSMPTSGGAAEFLNCFKYELIPYIDRIYLTDTAKRTLMGHSLGGYFTLYALSCDWLGKSVFNKYVAASPSLDYSNGYLLDRFKSLKDQKTTSKELLISVGEEEKLAEFPVLLNILKNTPLAVQSVVFPKMGHMETAIVTFKKALEAK